MCVERQGQAMDAADHTGQWKQLTTVYVCVEGRGRVKGHVLSAGGFFQRECGMHECAPTHQQPVLQKVCGERGGMNPPTMPHTHKVLEAPGFSTRNPGFSTMSAI